MKTISKILAMVKGTHMYSALQRFWHPVPPDIARELNEIRSKRAESERILKETRATLDGESEWFKEKRKEQNQKGK